MILVVLLYALFASVFTIAKWGLSYTEPLFLVGSRMFLAGGIILLFLGVYDRKALSAPRTLWPKIVALGIFNIYLTNVLEFWGLQYLTSFKTCFLYSLSPFLSALFSYLLFSEQLNGKKWLGLAIGVGGMIPVLLSEEGIEREMAHVTWLSLPVLAVMGAAVATVYGWILMRQVVKDGENSPLMANGYSMLIGGMVSLLHSACVENWHPLPVTEVSPFLISTLLLTLISNLICYNLYGFLLKKYTAPFLSFAGYLTPFFAALFGWFFLGETIPVAFFVAAGILFAGLYLFYREELHTEIVIQTRDAQAI